MEFLNPAHVDSGPPVTPFPIGIGEWSMTGHMDRSVRVLNDDLKRPGPGSRTPAVRARSSLSQPSAVGCAAGPDELLLDRTRILEGTPNTIVPSLNSMPRRDCDSITLRGCAAGLFLCVGRSARWAALNPLMEHSSKNGSGRLRADVSSWDPRIAGIRGAHRLRSG